MAITCGFFNAIENSPGSFDRVYNSEQIGDMFRGLVSDGVFQSVGEGLIVKAKSGMTVQVGTGKATIDSTNSMRWLKNDAKMNVTLAAAHLTLNRWSAIVIKLDESSRQITIVEKAGTPATSPTKPTMANNVTTKEKCLAYVYVPAKATAISQADIIDMRASNLCGWVTGLVKQIDTSELFIQYQDWMTKRQTEFDKWYQNLTGSLTVSTKIRKYRKVVTTTNQQSVFQLDMAGYNYSADDVIFININGVMLIEGDDYTINTGVSPVRVETRFGLDANNSLEIIALKSVVG